MRKAYKISKESNKRAELKAIIAAVHKLPQDATRVQIISDSMYALNTLKGNWNRNANLDLFEAWDKVLAKRECLDIEFLWVKGHSGDFYNELCDSLCTNAMGYDANKEFEKYKKI
jgi:ribonuclease HI